MDEKRPNHLCQQPKCTLAEDQTCLEGLPNPFECPHVIEAPPEVHDREAEPLGAPTVATRDLEEEISMEGWVELPSGYELGLPDAACITGSHKARVIVVAGEPGAGKTTLLACLYEKFCEGSFTNLRFAGSQTLLAFERTCHPSRISSEAETPDTERTKGLSPSFLHMLLQDINAGSAKSQHLLLTDISGEAYLRATDRTEEARRLSFVPRADRFVLLVDGERLADKRQRQEALNRAMMLLRSLTEASVLCSTSSVRVVLSKIDLLQPSAVDRSTLEFVQYAKGQFEAQCGGYGDFAISEVAARPQQGSDLPYAHGLDHLIRDWLSEDPVHLEWTWALGPMPRTGRESDLFLWRHFAK